MIILIIMMMIITVIYLMVHYNKNCYLSQDMIPTSIAFLAVQLLNDNDNLNKILIINII